MRLRDKNARQACEALRDILVQEGITVPTADIFFAEPNTGIPTSYITITPNGGISDREDVAEMILLLEINVKLLQNKNVNTIKMDYITNSISSIFENPKTKDNYEFLISKDYNLFDYTDITMGYGVKMINLFCRINRITNN